MASLYKILQPALANPIRFTPVGTTQYVAYQTPNFDQTPFYKQFMNWENSSCYTQKFRTDHQTAIQFHANTDQDFQLYLVDSNDRVWRDYASQRYYDQFSGNTIERYGQIFPLYTATFVVDFVGIPEGIYFLKSVITYPVTITTNESEIYISEPMYISDGIENTLLLEVKNNKIAFNTYFGDWAFRLRVEGYIYYDSPDSVDTQYNDEYYNLRLLNSYPFRKFKMLIGGVAGITANLLDTINIYTGCTSLKIDSSFYSKGEGAKMTISKYDKRFFAELELREQNNYYDTVISEGP
jgi:hypothetical protein